MMLVQSDVEVDIILVNYLEDGSMALEKVEYSTENPKYDGSNLGGKLYV